MSRCGHADGEAALTDDQIRDLLAAHINAAGDVDRFAALNGVRAGHIAKVLTGRKQPCHALARALGLRVVTRYERISP